MNVETKTLNFNARLATYLLEQAEGGYHPLFENDLIRRALRSTPASDRDNDEIVRELHDVIVEFTELDGVTRQRAYIAALPSTVQTLVVQLYFRFLDQFMQRTAMTLH